MLIYHITSRVEWDKALAAGAYTAPSLTQEGFIHASTREQVTATAARYYQGVHGLVLLEIDGDQVQPELRFDPVHLSTGDTTFPHIYGPLNPSAVRKAYPFEPEPDGSFRLPVGIGQQ